MGAGDDVHGAGERAHAGLELLGVYGAGLHGAILASQVDSMIPVPTSGGAR
jgi:hypothetical protein